MIWGILNLLIENNSIDILNLGTFIDLIIKNIYYNIKMINQDDPEPLGRILLAIQTMEKFDTHFNRYIVIELEKYIFS